MSWKGKSNWKVCSTLLHDLILNQYLSVMISSSDPFKESSSTNMNTENVIAVYTDIY